MHMICILTWECLRQSAAPATLQQHQQPTLPMCMRAGILTPRGTGTSGHVSANKFNLRRAPVPRFSESAPAPAAADKKPNQEILEHNRKRQVEVKLLELQDDLEAQGWVAQHGFMHTARVVAPACSSCASTPHCPSAVQ